MSAAIFPTNNFLDMPKVKHLGTLKKGKAEKVFSKGAVAQKNSQHKDLQIQYSTSSSSGTHALRDLKQVSYPELCSWGEKTCKKFLWQHGVLSDQLPLCYSCGEEMVRSGRNVNDELKCTTKSCYIHPKLTFPVEAFTPLHSQVRQHQDGDYTNFLRICYLIGIKTPMDSMEHLLEGVTVKRMTAWAQDIRLALATCEYLDSTSFEFPAGILEFDTCTATVQRKASQSAVQHAKQKRYKVERKANKFLKRKRMPVMKRPASSSKKTNKIFRGRHIVFKLRCVDGSVATKQYAVLPLPPKVADKGTFDSQTF